jgi:hypothetical protein
VDLVRGEKKKYRSACREKDYLSAGPLDRPLGYFESVEKLAITSLECPADAWWMFLSSILQIMEVDFRRMGNDLYKALFDFFEPSLEAPTAPVISLQRLTSLGPLPCWIISDTAFISLCCAGLCCLLIAITDLTVTR